MFTARRIHRPTISCALACALLLSAVSSAAARPIDVAREAALAQERYYSSYVSPPRDDAARIAARQDLRSPDTRDVAAGREFPPTPTVVTLKPVRAPEPAASGFDWVAAATGACAALGLILLMTGGVLLARRRAQRAQPVAVS